jgi:hypothetical protein
MKTSLLLTTLFILFLPLPGLFAQDYQVNWGPAYSRDGVAIANFRLAGFTADRYNIVVNPRRSNTLLTFDLNHRLLKPQSLELVYNQEDLVLDKFVETAAGTYGYFVNYDRKDNQFQLLASAFTAETFTEVRPIYQHRYEGRWNLTPSATIGRNSGNDLGNDLEVSLDKSRVSFVNQLSARDKNTPERCALALFDAELNLVWEKMYEFEYTDKQLTSVQSEVSNDGTIFLLTKITKSAEERQATRGLPRYDYRVYRFTETAVQTFDILLPAGLAPTDARLFLPDGSGREFLLTGFYTNEARNSGLQGIFTSRVQPESGVISSHTAPFAEDFLRGLIRERDLKKDRGLDDNFSIQNYLQFTDGSFGFIAERSYVTSTSYVDMNGIFRETYTYHSDQLVIPRLSADGELLNVQKVDKTFSSEDYVVTSYSLALANGKVYLVYNDFKNNRERRNLKNEGRGKGRYTDLCVIDEAGEIIHQSTLFSSREIDLTYLPAFSDYNGDNLLLMGVSRKKYKCGLLRLD